MESKEVRADEATPQIEVSKEVREKVIRALDQATIELNEASLALHNSDEELLWESRKIWQAVYQFKMKFKTTNQ